MSLLSLMLWACAQGEPSPQEGLTPHAAAAEPAGQSPFSGERAMEQLVELTQQGQRWYGSPQRPAAVRDLQRRLEGFSEEVTLQSFPATEPVSGETWTLTNLVGRMWPERSQRVILGSHWDTRLWAEEDPDPRLRQQPIPGANDGTSGVALLLELGRVLSEAAPLQQLGVDIVLFDGEEFGRPGRGGYCKGSEHFADQLTALYPQAPPRAGIVVDMVADRQLTLRREPYSQARARPLVDLIWSLGRARQPEVFVEASWPPIKDDHVPLHEAGVPAVLVIDFDYPPWHTHADTIEQCSASSLQLVGDTLLETLQHLDRASAP